MVKKLPMKMVMTGGWFIIALLTLITIDNELVIIVVGCCRDTHRYPLFFA